MSTRRSKPAFARRRVRRFVRAAGWASLAVGVAWAVVASIQAAHIAITPFIFGLSGLVAARGLAYWLRRYSARFDTGELNAEAVHAQMMTRRRRSSAAPQAKAERAAYSVKTVPRRPWPWRRILFVGVTAFFVFALVAASMCFDDQPLVGNTGDMQMKTYEKVQQFLESHDPRAGSGGIRTLVASEDEVNLVLNYAARRFKPAAVRVALEPDVARVQASIGTSWSPFGDWLNIDATVRAPSGMPSVERLRVGSLPVPGFLAKWLAELALARFGASERGRIAQDMIQSVAIKDSEVRIVYSWREDLVTRARATLVPAEEHPRFRAYVEKLAEVTGANRNRDTIALTELLPPMFSLAQQRSARGDAAAENRAAIITLAFYVFGRDLSTIIPAASEWRSASPIEVTLHGADDTAQHYLVSATLAIEGGTALADALGVFREMDDSRRKGTGKGFSFPDIGADRSGTRFGLLAAKSPGRIQQALTGRLRDSDLMPNVTDLPDEIPEAEFKTKYGGIGSPRYNELLADIDARIARTPLLQ